MARKRTHRRDHKAEYRRRILRGFAKGQTKAQARGHGGGSARRTKSRTNIKSLEDAKLQFGLKVLRAEKSLAKAAKTAGMSPERLRSYALDKGIIEKRGRRWYVKLNVPRRVPIYSGGKQHTIIVGQFDQASLVGKYMAAVRQFLITNDRAYLKPFIGKSVTDIDGKTYRLETGPNKIYRLSHSGAGGFEQIYRFVFNQYEALMSKPKSSRKFNHGEYESRLRKAYERLGTDTPKCTFCDATDPFALELHHIAGQEFGDELVIVCLNHHAMLSNAYKDHPPKIDGPRDPLEAFGHFLLGFVELLSLAIVQLREIALALINRAETTSADQVAS